MTFRPSVWPLTKAAEGRARQADPNEGRCLVSGREDAEVVHVAPRELSANLGLIRSVEWAWGLREDRLNLDTRTNLMFLGTSLHALYKQKKWALLPEEHIIDQFFYQPESSSEAIPHPRESFPEISGDTFRYTFLPLTNGFTGVGIVRQVGDNPATVHTYPFASIPVLTSHVHPKFALLNLTLILSELKDEPFIRDLVSTNSIVNRIARLCAVWTNPFLPIAYMTDLSFVPIAFERKDRRRDRRDSDATCVGRVLYPEHELTNPPILPKKIFRGYRWGYAKDGLEEGEMYVLDGEEEQGVEREMEMEEGEDEEQEEQEEDVRMPDEEGNEEEDEGEGEDEEEQEDEEERSVEMKSKSRGSS